MTFRRPVFLCLAAFAWNVALADDWPTFRHDARRSGRTAERLDAAKLREQWVWRSLHPPQPAWAGPAKWDAYKNLRGLRSMRNYDPVFHVIAVGDAVYFGSSVDDAVQVRAPALARFVNRCVSVSAMKVVNRPWLSRLNQMPMRSSRNCDWWLRFDPFHSSSAGK